MTHVNKTRVHKAFDLTEALLILFTIDQFIKIQRRNYCGYSLNGSFQIRVAILLFRV